MIFQQLVNEESGCLSYLIGCGQAGQAVVVDPGRDRVADYLGIARKKGLRITHVLETHTHADHISGNRDLVAATQAAIVQLSVPVLAAAGGVALLGEALTPRLGACGAIILGGVALAVLGRQRV